MSQRTTSPGEGSRTGSLLDEGPSTDRVGGRDLTAWPSAGGSALLRGAQSLGRWLSPWQVWGLVLAVGLLLDGLVVVLGAALYRATVDGDGIDLVDGPALELAVEHRTADLVTTAQVVSDVADVLGMTVLVTTTAVVVAVVRRRWTPLVLVVTAVLGSVALTVVGKVVVGRSRPPQADAVPPYETSPSFPSGHTLNAAVFVGVLAYVLLRQLQARWARALVVVLTVGVALVVGASRVYLGHHWFSDVAVAWLLGALWVGVVVTGHRLFLALRRQRRRQLDSDGEVRGQRTRRRSARAARGA